jgi:hypothetical protein
VTRKVGEPALVETLPGISIDRHGILFINKHQLINEGGETATITTALPGRQAI